MWKQFTAQNTTQYVDMLPKLLKEYNNTKHLSIKITLIESSKEKIMKALLISIFMAIWNI